MTDDQKSLVAVLDEAFEPPCCFEIEMIRWLVEQENIGGAYKLASKTKPASFASAQFGDLPGARSVRIESKAVENGVHARRKLVTSFSLESFEVAVVFREYG